MRLNDRNCGCRFGIAVNNMTHAPSRADASMSLVEMISRNSYREQHVIAKHTSGTGNLSGISSKEILAEYSDKGLSAQDLRPNIHPIYQRLSYRLVVDSPSTILAFDGAALLSAGSS